MRLTWPLTGRAEEMRVIESATSDPDLSGVVICGTAGVGKSRIAREALSRAASAGCETRWAAGTSASRNLPLGAFASWAGSVSGDTLQLVRSAVEGLTTASEGGTVVLGVDDVHLIDELSTFVLHQVIERHAAKLVLTIRDGDPVPAATQELLKSGPLERLELQLLSSDETMELLTTTLGGPMDWDAARRLWRLTRGNVLYLCNIVEQEVTDGRIVERDGRWTWIGDPIVPNGLLDMVESRIGALPTDVGDVLDALTVGEPLELACLGRITDPAAVEEADVRGLIGLERVNGGVEVRVAHPLYAEVRRKRAAPTKLRRMRGLVATALAESEGDDMRTAVRRAALSIDSDLPPDSDLLLTAAKGAVWLADHTLANQLAEAEIRAGAGPEAKLVRAHALAGGGRGEEADSALAGSQADERTDPDHAVLICMQAATMLWGRADPTGAKKLVDDAWHTTPPEHRSNLDAFLAVYWAAVGDPHVALQASKELVPGELTGFVGALAAWATTVAAGDVGRTTEAVAAAESACPLFTGSLDAQLQFVFVHAAHAGALLLSGRLEEAWRVAEQLRQQAADLPGIAWALSSIVAGRVAVGAGRLDAACALLEPVVEMLSAAGNVADGTSYRCLIPYTTALAIRGETDQAAAALDALERHRHPGWQCLDHGRALAHAWVAAAQGVVSQAISTALSGAEITRERGQFAAEVLCLQTATQFGDRSVASRLRELEAVVEGPRVGLAARFAVAMQAAVADELAVVSREFEQTGDNIAAIDAAAHAARLYRRDGKHGSAYGCAARAEELAQQCGGATTPALRDAVEPLPLTSREREIVMLVGEGLANRAIAARLHLSERTVESHVYHAMTKTGTAGREELAALLPRR